VNRRLVISAFIILNLSTVLFMNRPEWLRDASGRLLDSLPHPVSATLRAVGDADHVYASLAGLDNQWVMFSYLPRYNDWRVIRAEYADSSTVVLPLPRQSERTFWEHNLFDFKDAKYHHNLRPFGTEEEQARRKAHRKAYAAYLARHYPEHNGAPVRAIVWDYYRQDIEELANARLLGSHRVAEVRFVGSERFPVGLVNADPSDHSPPSSLDLPPGD
jgi:hypothetical protein